MAYVIEYEVDGKKQYAHDAATFEEYLGSLGLDITRDTLKKMFYEEIYDDILEDLSSGVTQLNCDALVGDSLANYQWAIKSEVDDISNDIYESLLSNSRKGNTKADIAKRLKNYIDNLYDII